jgi:hypothetical protein
MVYKYHFFSSLLFFFLFRILIIIQGSRGNFILSRVLRAFSTARPDIGYCQGMNFVVGVLILGEKKTSF